MKTIKLIGILFFSLLITACGNEIENEPVSIQKINPNEALEMVADNEVQMIDVRSTDEIAKEAYGVDNVLNIPLDEIETRLDEIPKDKKIVLVCRTGNRSMKAANVLLDNGYTNIYNMTGGLLAWQEQGLAVISTSSCCSDPSSSECNPDGRCK